MYALLWQSFYLHTGLKDTTMLKMTHESLLLWEAQTELNDYEYENTTSPGILHKNIVVRENSTDSSTSLLSDVPCIPSLFPFHHLNNHESRKNCSRTYHPESQLKNSSRKHSVLLLLTSHFGKNSRARWSILDKSTNSENLQLFIASI